MKKDIIIDGNKSTTKELNEKKETLKSNERLVEVTPKDFHTLKRMQG